MIDDDIANALRERLSGTPDASPIVWENAPGAWAGGEYSTPEPPFWAVSQLVTPPERVGLDGWHIRSGRMIVAVMAPEGGFTGTAEADAAKIVTRFPLDLKIAAGSAEIAIVQSPYAQEGFNDGAFWRVNVHVRWIVRA